MNTSMQDSSRQATADAVDPLLAAAMVATLEEYKDALDQAAQEGRSEEAQAQIERIRAEIQPGPPLALLLDRQPGFLGWAVLTAASDKAKDGKAADIAAVSADDALGALQAPRRSLAGNLVRVLEENSAPLPRYLRDPLEAVLDDPRAWADGRAGEFARAAVDDLRAARTLRIDVLSEAEEYRLSPFEVVDALGRARRRVSADPSWYEAPDAGSRDAILRRDYEEELGDQAAAAGPQPGIQAAAGPPPDAQPACDPSTRAVSTVPLNQPLLPSTFALAKETDPCQSIRYLTSLVRTYGLGESGQLFLAGEQLSDRWAGASNWCVGQTQAAQHEPGGADIQNLDDFFYQLRRKYAKTDTAYAMRGDLYQAQLESPGFQQAWGDFVSQVVAYLSDPCACAGKQGAAPYRCIGVYIAAEGLRQAAAAQLTGLARMQIKELARSLQTVWQIFTDSRVVAVIDPITAGSANFNALVKADAKNRPAKREAAVVFGVAKQLLGPGATGLYEAWDKAILLDQVFRWVQRGRQWSRKSRCEQDKSFVGLLAAISALVPGAWGTPPAPAQSLPLASG